MFIFRRATLILSLIVLPAVLLNAAEFKFGLMNAVKSAGEQLDKKYRALGGGVPAAPSNAVAAAISYTKINISWNDNSSNEQGFRVRRSTISAGPFAMLASVGSNTTYYIDAGLIPNTTYYYRIYSYNGISESALNSAAQAQGATMQLSLTVSASYTNSNAYQTRVMENYAYMSCQTNGIKILDVSNSSSAVEVGSYNPGTGSCYGIDLLGDFLYAAYGTSGLKIFNVSNPASPVLVASIIPSVGMTATDVKVLGNYAYLLSPGRGMDIINISNPYSPVFSGLYSNISGGMKALFVNGNYVYIADGTEGVKIVNITNSSAPVVSGQIADLNPTALTYTMTNAVDVYVKGNYAFVADKDNGLKIIDISNPASPQIKGSLGITGLINSIFYKDNYVFVALYSGGLRVAGVFDKSAPAEFAAFTNVGTASTKNVCVSNSGRIYITTSNGLLTLGSNIVYTSLSSEPAAPSNLVVTPVSRTKINLAWTDNSDNEDGFKIERKAFGSTYAQIAAVHENITSYNDESVSDSTSYYYRLRAYNSVDNSAYLPEVGPVASISTVTLLGVTSLNGGTAYDLFVSTKYAYVANASSGLMVVDISNPKLPLVAGVLPTTGITYDVAVAGNYAYIANGSNGNSSFEIVDISSATNPLAVSGISVGAGSVYSVAIEDNYAYLACSFGMYVVDISNTLNPVIKGSLLLNSVSKKPGLFASWPYIYYVDSTNGFKIIDVSNPSSPALAGTVSSSYIGGDINDVYVYGINAYVANGSYGIKVFDISNPVNPVYAGEFNTQGDARSVFVKNKYAYVGDGTAGICVLDISSATKPVQVKQYYNEGFGYSVFYANNYAYMANGTAGFQVFDFGLPVSTSTVPSPQTNFSINVSSAYFVSMVWLDNSNNESGYLVERSTSIPFVVLSTANLSVNTTCYVDTGLRPNTTYYYRLRAYNSTGSSSISTIRVYTPMLDVNIVGQFKPGQYFYDVAATTTNVYAACKNSSGCWVVNISTPSVPLAVSFSSFSFTSERFAMKGNYLYFVSSTAGVIPVDVSTPSVPVVLSPVSTPGNALGIDIDGNYAYVADNNSGVRIFDISNAAAPVYISNHISNTVNDVKAKGDYVYLACNSAGLRIIDKSNINSPSEDGFYPVPEYAYCVEVTSSVAYLGEISSGGLSVVDVADSTNPLLITKFGSLSVYNLFIRGKYLFAACGADGIKVFDISIPRSPYIIASYKTTGNIYSVYNIGTCIYAACNDQGLQILKSDLP